jgi:hypothetical protein
MLLLLFFLTRGGPFGAARFRCLALAPWFRFALRFVQLEKLTGFWLWFLIDVLTSADILLRLGFAELCLLLINELFELFCSIVL